MVLQIIGVLLENMTRWKHSLFFQDWGLKYEILRPGALTSTADKSLGSKTLWIVLGFWTCVLPPKCCRPLLGKNNIWSDVLLSRSLLIAVLALIWFSYINWMIFILIISLSGKSIFLSCKAIKSQNIVSSSFSSVLFFSLTQATKLDLISWNINSLLARTVSSTLSLILK